MLSKLPVLNQGQKNKIDSIYVGGFFFIVHLSSNFSIFCISAFQPTLLFHSINLTIDQFLASFYKWHCCIS